MLPVQVALSVSVRPNDSALKEDAWGYILSLKAQVLNTWTGR